MAKHILHAPEGVRDIYGAEYARQQWVEETIAKEFARYGYEAVQPPLLESPAVFAAGNGAVAAKDLCRISGNAGNSLVLRHDFTPQIARLAAKHYSKKKEPLRFCYQGSTYTAGSQGQPKEFAQMGAELIGDSSIIADGEVISLVVEAFLAVGLKDFHLSIGQVDYFKGLCAEAGLLNETEQALRGFILQKDIIGAEALLAEAGTPKRYQNRLLQLSDLAGTTGILKLAEQQADNERSSVAIWHLRSLYEALGDYRVEQFVSFDFGLLNEHDYYTGVIFQGNAATGQVLVRGGRYDNLIEKFGKAAPAVGFTIDIGSLLATLEQQKVQIPQRELTKIVYHEEDLRDAIAEARVMRKEGHNVTLLRK
jgi:ATP phosphoribosyltransferase regulatory subunit